MYSGPHTLESSDVYRWTRPGASTSATRRRNSVGVSATGSPERAATNWKKWVVASRTSAALVGFGRSLQRFSVIELQLRALAAVEYPHDAWVLDEGNDPAVRAAAERVKVDYFTRQDIPVYDQAGPPFAATTKAGNVN